VSGILQENNMTTRAIDRNGSALTSSMTLIMPAGLAFALGIGTMCTTASAQYMLRNLVSNQPGVAPNTDPNLVNAWGIAFNPTGLDWVANNGTGKSTLYDGNGVPNALVVNVPSATESTGGNPTGIVFNNSTNFTVSSNGHTGPAAFLWATESGTIAGWNPNVPNMAPPASTQAFVAVNNSSNNAVYKGLAISNTATASHLYAADFHNQKVQMFDGTFTPVNTPGAFTDPNLPSNYAPFNARTLNNQVYVAYAQRATTGDDEDSGPGHGFIDVYDTSGNFVRRLVSQGNLNSPWGMTIAPANFGTLSGSLLVGNFGDGKINAFNPTTGQFIGTLNGSNGQPIVVDGLWGIDFGNGFMNQPTNTLFFAAGPDEESNGLYGRIDLVPAPGLGAFIGAAVLLGTRRTRRRE
jgi:uncharacterized protein (TIGR03118 family)